MLSSDSAEFLGLPEISQLIRATGYRDVNIYHVWHDPATRPLVPISHLMTHGIIYTKSKYSKGDDTLRDFSDYVMMYYSAAALKEVHQPAYSVAAAVEILGATRGVRNMENIGESVFVGGDPAKGKPYGCTCWAGEGNLEHPELSAEEGRISVPFDQSAFGSEVPWERSFMRRSFIRYQGDLR
jgi:hypothetical protein